VLHLVDCPLLVPPRMGPDGRARYVMLETLRAYGLDRLTKAGKQPEAAAALAGHALRRQESPGPRPSSRASHGETLKWAERV
jgi:hypothetical protein